MRPPAAAGASGPPADPGESRLFDLAYAGAFATAAGLSAALVALVLRSGLESPRLLVLECIALLVAAAFAPFLPPAAWRQRLLAQPWTWPLLSAGVLLSPVLALPAGRALAPVYPVAAAVGLWRAAGPLRRTTRAEAALLLLGAPVLGAYLLASQHLLPFTHLYAAEAALVDALNADSLHHMALSSILQRFGTPSLGVDGLAPLPYHFGSHLWFAGLASLGGVSARVAYPLGLALVAIPGLILGLCLAVTGALRPGGRAPPSLLLAIAGVLLIDGLGWKMHYISESYAFGLILWLASVPLLVDFAAERRRGPRADALRVAALLALVLAAAWMKVSSGFLLGMGFGFLTLRQFGISPRTVATLAGLACLGLAGLHLFRSVGSAGLTLSPFHLYRTPPPFGLDPRSPLYSLALPLLYLLAALLSRLLKGRLDREERLLAELVLVVTAVAALPGLTLALPGLDARWFQSTPQWLALPLLASAPLLCAPAARRFRAALSLLLLALLATTALRADATRLPSLAESLSARAEGRAPAEAERGASWSRLGRSLRERGAVFGPETAAGLRASVGSRIAAAVLEARPAAEAGRLLVFVPPSNAAYRNTRGLFRCVQRSFWIQALTGVPQLRGVGPDCADSAYFQSHTGPDPLNVELSVSRMCRAAAERGFDRVLVLRSVDDPRENARVDCPRP